MRRTTLALSLTLSLAGLAGVPTPLAPAASAQSLGNFTMLSAKKCEEAMEKELRPALFFFCVPGDYPGMSIDFQFTQTQVQDVLTKYNFAACKITITDPKSSRPWGSYQKLADEFGVTNSSALICVAYDRHVMSSIMQVVKKDDFMVWLQAKGKEHKSRIEVSETANTDLTQVEKWIDEKKLADAVRRLKSVQDKEKKLVAAVITRMKDLDGKLDAAGKARFDEGKALLDAGKKDEARPILEEVQKAFSASKYAWVKDVADAVKKANAK